MVESPDNPSPTKDNKRHWLDHAAVWAAAAAALAAGAAAVVGAWQGSIARKANEIAIRPYIKIALQPETFFIPASGGEGPRNIKFRIENIGKLPGLAEIATGADWQGCGRSITAVADKSHIATVFAFPDQKDLEYSSTGSPLDREHLALSDCRRWRPEIWIVVDVIYGQSKQYETRVCSRFFLKNDPDGWRLGATDTYPDEDCNYAK